MNDEEFEIKNSFHTYHNAKPSYLKEIIKILEPNKSYTKEEILESVTNRGYSVATKESVLNENLTLMRSLSLLTSEKKENNELTGKGIIFKKILDTNPQIFSDILHYIYYSTYDLCDQSIVRSWSYKTVSDLMWSKDTFVIDESTKKDIAAKVSSIAETKPNFGKTISFSSKSVDGVLNWLEDLYPTLIHVNNTEKKFILRKFCPPPLFILALDYLYNEPLNKIEYKIPLILTDEKIENICKICQLSKTSFDDVLELTVESFSIIHEEGGWERRLMLDQKPDLLEICL